jgi:hypothetical protein
MTDKKQDVIEINEYGLFAFCAKAQELIKQGYEFDLTSNVRAPMSYGTMFVAYMVPVADTIVTATEEKKQPENAVATDTVAEKPQAEEKVETEAVDKPEVKAVKKKAGTE